MKALASSYFEDEDPTDECDCKPIGLEDSPDACRFYAVVDDPQDGVIAEFVDNLKKKGYDYNEIHPHLDYEVCPFVVLSVSDMELNGGLWVELKVVLGKINDQAQKDGEKYEVLETVKRVVSMNGGLEILAFNVREVHSGTVKTVEAATGDDCKYCMLPKLREWRFKSGPPESPVTEITRLRPTLDSPPYKSRVNSIWDDCPDEDYCVDDDLSMADEDYGDDDVDEDLWKGSSMAVDVVPPNYVLCFPKLSVSELTLSESD